MRRLAIWIALSSLLVCTRIPAGPSSLVAWTPETVRLIKAGDAAKGEQLAYGCVACHGQSGLSVTPAFPHLAGQDSRYVYKQLMDFRHKKRINLQMNDIAASMTDQDIADIAAYFAAQILPSKVPSGDLPEVINLVTKGDGSRMVPACAGCHGRRGTGNQGYYGIPVLAGQKSTYLQIALREYRAGDRRNDVYSVMRDIAISLTDEEITALADYFAAQ